MKPTILTVAAVALVTAGITAAHAQDREGMWETSLGVGFQNSTEANFNGSTQAKLDSDTSVRLEFDYHYTDNLQIGISFGVGTTDYEASLATDVNGDGNADGTANVRGDLEFSTFLVNGTYNFMSGPFSPFVTGGLGWSWVDTNIATEPPQVGCWWDPWYGYLCTSFQDTKTLDGLTYQLGVGARYDFSDTLAVHGSYRINWTDFDQATSFLPMGRADETIGLEGVRCSCNGDTAYS